MHPLLLANYLGNGGIPGKRWQPVGVGHRSACHPVTPVLDEFRVAADVALKMAELPEQGALAPARPPHSAG